MGWRGELGSSAVSFVVALPVLAVFLCGAVDLGRSVFLGMALDDAAHAVCQEAASKSLAEWNSGAVAESRLRACALEAAPALGAAGLALDVAATCGDEVEVRAMHRGFDGVEGAFRAQEVALRSREVRVEARVDGTYLTPVGAIIAAAQGAADAGFSFRASAVASMDTTTEGGR